MGWNDAFIEGDFGVRNVSGSLLCLPKASLLTDHRSPSEVATGSIEPSLDCFSNPEGDGISGNAGTECETPTASVSLTGTVAA